MKSIANGLHSKLQLGDVATEDGLPQTGISPPTLSRSALHPNLCRMPAVDMTFKTDTCMHFLIFRGLELWVPAHAGKWRLEGGGLRALSILLSSDAQSSPWNAPNAMDSPQQRPSYVWHGEQVGPHQDLNILSGYSCISNDGNTDDDSLEGHGTHVSGSAAAMDNDFGVIGIAPGAPIVPVKVSAMSPAQSILCSDPSKPAMQQSI